MGDEASTLGTVIMLVLVLMVPAAVTLKALGEHEEEQRLRRKADLRAAEERRRVERLT